MVPMELQSAVNAELQRGERLVWFGQPRPRSFMVGGIIIALFGLPFTAFALFWTFMALVGTHFAGAPSLIGILFSLFGIPFIVVGLGMLSAPFWLGRRSRRIVYLLTNRRAVVIEPGFFSGSTVHSFQPERLTSITRTQRPDGSGDLVFEQFTTHHHSGHTTTRRGFIGIDNVREVEDLINSLVEQNLVRRDAAAQ